jgi:hypothetical protein
MQCIEHVGGARTCPNCDVCCKKGQPFYDSTEHRGPFQGEVVQHTHQCHVCRAFFVHTHKINGYEHTMGCPSCSTDLRYPNWRAWCGLFMGLLALVGAALTIVLVVKVYGAADAVAQTVATAVNETSETFGLVMHGTGTEVRRVLRSGGHDVKLLDDQLLLTADIVTKHGRGMLATANNITDITFKTLDLAADDVRAAVDFTLHQAGYSLWVVHCLFVSAKQCNEDFYGKFSLCKPRYHFIAETNTYIKVHEPCNFLGFAVWDNAAAKWARHQREHKQTNLDTFLKRNPSLEELISFVYANKIAEHNERANAGRCKGVPTCYMLFCMKSDHVSMRAKELAECILFHHEKGEFGDFE